MNWKILGAVVLVVILAIVGHGLWGAHQQESRVKHQNDCSYQEFTGSTPTGCAP